MMGVINNFQKVMLLSQIFKEIPIKGLQDENS